MLASGLVMQRRSFLRLSALTFTSLLGHAGCKGGGGGGGGTGDSGSSSGGPAREVIDAPERFPQSVASGDPRPDGVIVWARVEDPERPADDYEVELEIWPTAADGGGEGGGDEGTGGTGADPETTGGDGGASVVVMVTAEARFDHCVKVRVEGLQPGTAYSYRFLYIRDDIGHASRTAHTKTAPEPDADVPVRFAFASCQDFGGRWYNSYVVLLQQPDLDFFVHLGDYVYETAGDSTFQGGTDERSVTFDDQAGAIELTSGDGSTYYAARSLDNYRQLYRTFRSDPVLQSVHEQLPMIAIWDDHEFSDDCHGVTATYTDGREDEADAARRAAANQAWFEYMPVDYARAGAAPDFTYDAAVPPPDDLRIHRDIEYGRHVHLVMTDLRSYRPDHLVPEDAYPGAIALDEAQLLTVAPDTSGGTPYVDIDGYAGGSYAELLRQVAQDAGYDPERITGNVSATWINDTIADSGSDLPPIEAMELDALPRGLAFHQIFKRGLHGQLGARYLVARAPFLWYATYRQGETGGAAQRIMGQAQQDWFLDTMRSSTHTWKIWGNEFCLTSLDIDLSGAPLPAPFNQAFTMSAEDWNGAPHNRAELIDALAEVDNVVAITGDIHSFFAGTPFSWAGAAEGNRVVELVTGAISSSTYRSLLVGQVQADPGLAAVPGVEAFAMGIRDLLQGGPNPCMGFCEPGRHGFGVITASAGELVIDLHMIAEDHAQSSRYDDPGLAGDFTVESFMVSAGSRDLYRLIEAEWLRWDPTVQQWV
jgi:alkaline phosphatase D